MIKLLHLDFLPRSPDLAILVLRLGFGIPMVWLHGWPKLATYSAKRLTFGDPLGIGSSASLSLAIFGELVLAAMVVLGLFTRFAALGVGITMAVAFFLAHDAQLSGPKSGEMAFLFMIAFAALFVCGGGRFSLDAKLGAKA